MVYHIALKREIVHASILATALGLSLAFGFLPFCARVDSWMADLFTLVPVNGQPWAFPVLSGLFFLTLFNSYSPPERPVPRSYLWLRVPFVLFIALLFGLFQPGSLFEAGWQVALWPILVAPVGEELLFRGWLYGVFERLYPKTYLTLMNPLPISTWMSSLAFALWHLQNDGGAFVFFQIGYTFFVGIWLAVWRWHSGSIFYPIVGHCLLNLFSVLF